MNIAEKLERFLMTPDDWAVLNQAVASEEYAVIVKKYQKREFERLPRCNTVLGLCRNYCCGHCTSKKPCRYKTKAFLK